MKIAKMFANAFGIPEQESKFEDRRLVEAVEEKQQKETANKEGDTHYMPQHAPSNKKVKQTNKLGKMGLKLIKPITFTQQDVFKSFMSGANLMLHGVAGTGKSFIGLYLALKEVERYTLNYDKVIIIRSGVPSRDLGYLPGNVEEKAAVYEEPYRIIVNKLYDRGDAYQILKQNGMIEFQTTSFLRGITFEKAVILVDEIQNMSYGELSTIITRMGDDSRVIFCGDFRQTDLFRSREREGLMHFMKIIGNMSEFSSHEFNITDIVRGKLVKSFIVEETEYRDKHPNFDS